MKTTSASPRRWLVLPVLLGTARLMSACGERPQDAPRASGKYLGKPDTRPWEGGSLTFESGEFKRGEKTSWESAMRTRAQNQNEYGRTQ